MKKTVKRILFVIIGVIVIIAGILVANFYEILIMSPAETGLIQNTEIFSIKNNRNSLFFIKTGNEYILIDAGTNAIELEESMKGENINPDLVTHILLTHSDSDHVAALTLFPNAKIYLNEDEIQMINGTTKRNGNQNNSLPKAVTNDELVVLTDEQELVLGEYRIRAIKAPGHTPGSMIYILNDEYVFSGDAFKINNNNIETHPFSMDEEISKNSIEKLKEMMKNKKLVVTAHYGYYETSKLNLD